jgi:hypothetical protein
MCARPRAAQWAFPPGRSAQAAQQSPALGAAPIAAVFPCKLPISFANVPVLADHDGAL